MRSRSSSVDRVVKSGVSSKSLEAEGRGLRVVAVYLVSAGVVIRRFDTGAFVLQTKEEENTAGSWHDGCRT